VVADFDYLFKGRQDHATTFQEELENCPVVKERIAMGKQVAVTRATKDYTYRAKQAPVMAGCWLVTPWVSLIPSILQEFYWP